MTNTPSHALPRRVVVSGLPGGMATLVAEAVAADHRYQLSPTAFSGGRSAGGIHEVKREGRAPVRLQLSGAPTAALLERLVTPQIEPLPPIVVDYSTPDAATQNAIAFARRGLSFVTGTTGIDTAAVEREVRDAGVVAVVAPNMAAPLVAFMAMVEWAAEQFPGALAGCDVAIAESHQATKRDVSGTAKRLLGPLCELAGLDAEAPGAASRITSLRDPDSQRSIGIPDDALAAHGWHRYTMTNDAAGISLELQHRVLGRGVYIDGTMRALRFLDLMTRRDDDDAGETSARLPQPGAGRVYSMIDVLRGAA